MTNLAEKEWWHCTGRCEEMNDPVLPPCDVLAYSAERAAEVYGQDLGERGRLDGGDLVAVRVQLRQGALTGAVEEFRVRVSVLWRDTVEKATAGERT